MRVIARAWLTYTDVIGGLTASSSRSCQGNQGTPPPSPAGLPQHPRANSSLASLTIASVPNTGSVLVEDRGDSVPSPTPPGQRVVTTWPHPLRPSDCAAAGGGSVPDGEREFWPRPLRLSTLPQFCSSMDSVVNEVPVWGGPQSTTFQYGILGMRPVSHTPPTLQGSLELSEGDGGVCMSLQQVNVVGRRVHSGRGCLQGVWHCWGFRGWYPPAQNMWPSVVFD